MIGTISFGDTQAGAGAITMHVISLEEGPRSPPPHARSSRARPSTTTIDALDAEDLEQLPPALRQKLEELEQLTRVEDWDDERGEAILERQWQDARFVLARASTTTPVFVSASGDGYVHLTWPAPNGDALTRVSVFMRE